MDTLDTNLISLFAFIGEGYSFTQERYPNRDLSTPHKIFAFAVGHSSVHIAKGSGQIAGEVERYDHGEEMNAAILREAVAKMFLNTLKLADVLGMTPHELVEGVQRVVKPI